MNRLNNLLLGLTLSAFLAAPALASSTLDSITKESKPSATSGPSATIAAAATPAPAAATAPAVSAPTAAATPSSPSPAAVVASKEVKIGFVDYSKVATESKPGKAAAASVKARTEKLKAKIEAKEKQLAREEAAIKAKLETLTPKERAAKAKEFQKKVTEYQKLARSSEEEMEVMREKLNAEMIKSIKKAAASYAKSHGYALIVDEKSVLFASDALEPKDLTEELIPLVGEK
ncbi:MAG TPA: OmpH family outer membrane protein [Geomonas sp.]|nr:OmpH family outer membrane protein [Geomonas sp.]